MRFRPSAPARFALGLGLLACNAANPGLESPRADLGHTPTTDAAGGVDGALTDAGPLPVCVPGTTASCPCAGDVEGLQTCQDTGVFAPCECPNADDAAAGGGGAPTRDSGTGGTGGTGTDAGQGGVLPVDDAGAGGRPDAQRPDAGASCVDDSTDTIACGFNGNGLRPRRCVAGTWTDDGPCDDPDSCANGEPVHQTCGLNLRGDAPAPCEAGQPGAPGPCADPDVCVDGAENAESCGFNGNGRETSRCVAGQWSIAIPCDDVDECTNDVEETQACGVLGNGTQARVCAAGIWSAWSSCDDPDRLCDDGARESVPCGLNRRGFRTHVCANMHWGEFGPCEDPDLCIDAARETAACGVNGRGATFRVCAEGQWTPFGACDDPDVCADAETESRTCGLNARGEQARTCLAGQWSAFAACDDPDACVDGLTQSAPCGLNRRGTASALCVAGQWGPQGPCVDPDVCLDGAAEVQPCGALGDGTQRRVCAAGRWGALGACLGATPCPDPANPACPLARLERCNGLDDDLDGQTDEGLSGENVLAGPFETALEPVIERGLSWLRTREGGLGHFNSDAESTASNGLGTLAFLERRSQGGVGPPLGYAGLAPADQAMLDRVVRTQIAEDPGLTNPAGALYVYRTGVNVAGLARFLESGGPEDVGAAVSVSTALSTGVDTLSRTQGQDELWDAAGPGMDLEQSYMAATGLSAASRILPGADATLARMAPALDAIQNPDGGFPDFAGDPSTMGATLTALWIHRLAGTPADAPRILQLRAWLETHYTFDAETVGFATEQTFWQPWNGTRALQGFRLGYAALVLGTLDPVALGYPAAPRGLWFDTAHALIATQQADGAWRMTPASNRSRLSMQALSVLTLSRSLGGARLAEADLSLRPACNDGVDNDGDGRLDLLDPDCPRACGTAEVPRPACDDARDNDADGAADFPDDLGCSSLLDADETDPACGNRRDDDADGRIDWPADPGCESRRDLSEADPALVPACANGRDDDGDALIDFGRDPECLQAAQNDERAVPACLGQPPITLLPGVTTFDGVTNGNDFQGTCGGVRGTDTLFAFVADVPQDVVFSTANDATLIDTVLYLRRSCDAAQTEIACHDDVSAQDPLSTLSVRLEAGTYFLVVDAKVGGGAFRLTVNSTLRPPGCGDGADNDTDGRVDLLDPGCTGLDDQGEADPAQPAACANTRDDDADGQIDFPFDAGCAGLGDTDERDPPVAPACANGLDDDADGATDFPDDASCLGRGDESEFRPVDAQCADHTDNDLDGLIDFPGEPGCLYPADRDEADPPVAPACANGRDDDADARADFPVDPGCAGRGDASEADPAVAPSCANGRDDDADGDVDFPRDPGCGYAADPSETDPARLPACFNGDDDDGNGRLDWPDDPGCYAAADPVEAGALPVPARCIDTADNDQDGATDLADLGCMNPSDDDENNPAVLPLCGNGRDDDQDNAIDWPQDPQCQGAGDITESLGCRAGLNVPLIPRNGTVNGATLVAGADRFLSLCGGAGAPDAVYRYSLAQARTLVVSLNNPGTRFPATVSVRRDCEESSAELTCAGGAFAPTPSVTLRNAAVGDYYVIVDGNPTQGVLSRLQPIALAPDPRAYVPNPNDMAAGQGWVDGGNDAFDNYGLINLTVAGQSVATTIADPGDRAIGGITIRTIRDFPHPNVMRFRIESPNAAVGQRVTLTITGNLGSDDRTIGEPTVVPFGASTLKYLRTTDGVPSDPPIFQMLVPSDPADVDRLTVSRLNDVVTLTGADIHLPAVFYLVPSYHAENTVLTAVTADLVAVGVGNQALFGNFELTVTEQ